MTRSTVLALFVAFSLTFVACGGGSTSDTFTFSCDNAAKFDCDRTTAPSVGQGGLESECRSNGGTVVTSCPTAGLVGCCAVASGTVSLLACSYSGASTPITQASCTAQGGKFSTTF